MKHKNLTKRIIAGLLAIAIVLAGVSFDATTAHAATLDKFVNGGTITMKPGDTKKILVQDKDGNDIAWKHSASSDESVVEVESDFVDTSVDLTECIVLIAKSTGTATVYAGGGMKMTVTVTKPKMTAAQKKCKHVFKVTRKATCERVGVKTCKRCRYQKDIATVAHKYVNTIAETTECDGWYTIYQCNGCECEDPLKDHKNVTIGHEEVEILCDTMCTFRTTVKYDKNGKITPDSEYKTLREAGEAMLGHKVTTGGNHHAHAEWEEEYGVRKVTKTIKTCKWCGIEKK